jgi:hypothetical protein
MRLNVLSNSGTVTATMAGLSRSGNWHRRWLQLPQNRTTSITAHAAGGKAVQLR